MSENKYIGLEDLDEINKKMNEKNEIKMNDEKTKIEKKSFFDKYSTKEKIIIFSFVLGFLIITMNLIKSYNPYNTINYRVSDSAKMIENSKVEYDRDVYWIVESIIFTFLNSNANLSDVTGNGESGTESYMYYKYPTEEYYKALTNDYRNYIKKSKYLELAEEFISNYNNNYENSNHNTSEQNPINKIYKLNNLDNYYLVELNTKKPSYIGINLSRATSRFNIFYLEFKGENDEIKK